MPGEKLTEDVPCVRLDDEELLYWEAACCLVPRPHGEWLPFERALAEIREHRAAQLTDEEREALGLARSLVVSSRGYAPSFAKDKADEADMERKHVAALAILDKLIGVRK